MQVLFGSSLKVVGDCKIRSGLMPTSAQMPATASCGRNFRVAAVGPPARGKATAPTCGLKNLQTWFWGAVVWFLHKHDLVGASHARLGGRWEQCRFAPRTSRLPTTFKDA